MKYAQLGVHAHANICAVYSPEEVGMGADQWGRRASEVWSKIDTVSNHCL
ncbi:MAG: hypothetical protein KIT86_00600 [Hydrogenophaga sp.]|jgi:hypothetical protein|nr:hypothetical protein [Hydrogenophaga sp.]